MNSIFFGIYDTIYLQSALLGIVLLTSSVSERVSFAAHEQQHQNVSTDTHRPDETTVRSDGCLHIAEPVHVMRVTHASFTIRRRRVHSILPIRTKSTKERKKKKQLDLPSRGCVLHSFSYVFGQ